MSIGVLERPRIAAPECVVRRVGDRGADPSCLLHHRIHFGFARDIVPECELGRATRPQWDPGFMGHILARPDGELHPVLQIEERNLAVLELGADDASRGKPSPSR